MREALLDAVLDTIEASTFPEGFRERLRQLDVILERFSERLSLTGFRGAEQRARRYFAEALRAARFVPFTGRALDVGSGAGSPALPLAVVRPSVHWLLAESRERKAAFLREAVSDLGLANVEVACRRVDRSWREGPYELVTTRGVVVEGALEEALRTLVTAGGLHLWFSSRDRLREFGSSEGSWSCEGPFALGEPQEESGGFVLVRRRSS